MSYILHVWEGPTPDAADDVEDLIEAPDHGGIMPSARFADYAAALRKKYPDAHMLEATGKDGDSSVWADSPLEPSGEAFFRVAFKAEKSDYKLVHFIVKTAGAHGLHVYDSDTGQLWRKDDPPPPAEPPKPPRLPTPEAPLMSLHRFAAVPAWAPESLPPRPAPFEGEQMEVGVHKARRLVAEPVASRLASFGWREGQGRLGNIVFQRTLGPARQGLHLWMGTPGSYDHDSEWTSTYLVSAHFAFEIPAVQETLLGIHPRWRKKREKERAEEGDGYSDIECPAKDLFGVEMLKPLGYTLISPTWMAVRVQSRRDIEWWTQAFTAWFERQAEPLLAACTDLVTLNRFVVNPWRLATGTEQHEWNLMSTLALARMAPHPDVPWADCLTGVRYRADRLAMDEALLERTIAALEEALP